MSYKTWKPANMQQVSRGLRAYFAPVWRASGAPTFFDPAKHANFDLDAPPEPWIDVGWIDGFKRTSETKIGTVRAGKRGASGTQFRTEIGARLEFEFRQWGKLQMALAAGSEHFNVLESQSESADAPGGGAPCAAAVVLEGSTSSEIVLSPDSLQRFEVGDVLAVDVDYQQQLGYLGTGVAAGYTENTSDLPLHPDYIRRITFNVARVAAKTQSSLELDRPLIGGAPVAGGGVQKVVAFVDREGGKFFQEWSALFVLPESSGGRVFFHYPRLQSAAAAAEASVDVGGGLNLNSLRASFTAMPFVDDVDGEPVLCYRVYVPSPNAPVL